MTEEIILSEAREAKYIPNKSKELPFEDTTLLNIINNL